MARDSNHEQDDQGELEAYFLKLLGSKPKQEIVYIHKDELEIDYDREQVAQLLGTLQKAMFKNYSKTGFVRLSGFSNLVKLKDIQASLVHKYVTVQGTIVRQSQTKPLVRDLAFECCSCQKSVVVEFVHGKYKAPSSCPAPGCRSKQLIPNRKLATTVDSQIIKIQEKLPNEKMMDSGRVPRHIECELTGQDLVDTCVPGDVVSVSGVVRVMNFEDGNASAAQMFYCYIDVNTLSVLSGSGTSQSLKNSLNQSQQKVKEPGKDCLELSEKEVEGIKRIKSYPQGLKFKLLVNSLCPSIYGHEIVKAGLLLTLFGGRQRDKENGIGIRSNPHILIVGDPGLGKSQMLNATVKVAPRGVYVSGNLATTAGLTVTVTKDSDGSQTLEAGALILGDQGVCCIDEFDKMTEHHALLEAMEQQSVSIAKAGIVCSLPTRTSVVAAANPVAGHYNKEKTVSENLKMGPALLSRFDMIFILLDKPDYERDRFLSDHIMKLHQNRKSKLAAVESTNDQFGENSEATHKNNDDLWFSFRSKIRLDPETDTNFEPVPPSLLRKYVSYARSHCHPRLSQDAAALMQQFYLHLRRNCRSNDSTPVTTRQLESMIRLAEARAKSELREEVDVEDARDVIAMIQSTLEDVQQEPVSGHTVKKRKGLSVNQECKAFVAAMKQLSERTGNVVFTREEMKQAYTGSISFEQLIEILNHQGYLLNKGGGKFQLMI